MKPFRERSAIAVGLVSVAVLTVLTLFAFSINRFSFITQVYLVEADFADASGLTPENEVRVAGLKVGKVRSVTLAGDRVRVKMEVKRNVRLGDASTAEIKLKTLLGSKFVAVTPRGGEPHLGEGGRIPLERTSVPFELYEVTNQTVETIGRLDAQAFNDALNALAKLTEDPNGNFGRALDGLSKATTAIAERDAELQSLLQQSDHLLGALASRSNELGRVLDAGAKVLDVLTQRQQALRSFLAGTDRVSAELADLIRRNRGALDPALRDLHAVLLEVAKHNQPNGNLDDIFRTLGPAGESFARVFTQGTWADVFTETVLGLPVPPVLGGASAPPGGGGLAGIFGTVPK